MRVLTVDKDCWRCGGAGTVSEAYEIQGTTVYVLTTCPQCVRAVEIEAVLTLHAALRGPDGNFAFDERLPVVEKVG